MSRLSYSLSELAEKLSARVVGDSSVVITGIAPLDSAKKCEVSFLSNPVYKKCLPGTQAGAVIISSQDAELCTTNALIVADPYLAFAQVGQLFINASSHKAETHASAVIGKECKIPPCATIGAQCVLGNNVTLGENVVLLPGCILGDNVTLGAGTRLFARVTLYNGVTVGSNVTLHSGVVIGSDGFGYANNKGVWHKFPQTGSVQIGEDVEIGANTVVDCGAVGDTIIEKGVIIDNLVQIAHNVRIGAHTAIAGCVGIAGSTTIGKHCLIGGATGIAGHLKITSHVQITGMSMVTHSILKPGVYSSGQA